jgi:hypothetical protein
MEEALQTLLKIVGYVTALILIPAVTLGRVKVESWRSSPQAHRR